MSAPRQPTIVCLCGSTRFGDAFREANLLETLRGNIVLTIGCDTRSDAELLNDPAFLFRWHPPGPPDIDEIKARLDELHLRKIDLADEVLILNVGGYVGESTARELVYARQQGKRVRFLEGPGRFTTSNSAPWPITYGCGHPCREYFDTGSCPCTRESAT